MQKALLLRSITSTYLTEIPYWFSFRILLSLQSLYGFFLPLHWVGWFGGSLPCCASAEQIAWRATSIVLLLIWQENWRFVFFFWGLPRWQRQGFLLCLLACFLKNAGLRGWVESQKYFMPKGCWKIGTGYRGKIWINAPDVQMIPVWAQTVLLVSDNLHGTGRRWNRRPGYTCLLAHGMVWLAGHLQCHAEGALLSGYWQQISYMKQNLMDGWIFWLEKDQPYSLSVYLPCKF